MFYQDLDKGDRLQMLNGWTMDTMLNSEDGDLEKKDSGKQLGSVKVGRVETNLL